MDEISFTGGSRIGWVNASWPFARLSCRRDGLTLRSLGKSYEFRPDQVASFGTFGSIPLLANGLQIHHNRLDYPERIVFWCMGSRDSVLQQVAQLGFAPAGAAVERPRGMPFRWSFAIACVLLWNVLFLADQGFRFAPIRHPPGLFSAGALLATFLLATSLKISPALQRMALKPGRTIGEVAPLLTLLQIVSGLMAIGFTCIFFFAPRA